MLDKNLYLHSWLRSTRPDKRPYRQRNVDLMFVCVAKSERPLEPETFFVWFPRRLAAETGCWSPPTGLDQVNAIKQIFFILHIRHVYSNKLF